MKAPRTIRFIIPAIFTLFILLGVSIAAAPSGAAQDASARTSLLDRFHAPASDDADRSPALLQTPGRFSGYTNYWHDLAWTRSQYGNLFQMSVPDVGASILQTKADIAEELGVPGLALAEGFIAAWLAGPRQDLKNPSAADLDKALAGPAARIEVFAPLTRDLGPALMKRAASGGVLRFRSPKTPIKGTPLIIRKRGFSSWKTGRGACSRSWPTSRKRGTGSGPFWRASRTRPDGMTSTAVGSGRRRSSTA